MSPVINLSSGDESAAIVRLYRHTNLAEVTVPLVFDEAYGCRVRTLDGREFLDLIGGYGVASTGWNHPRLVEAVRRQAGRTLFAPPMLPHVRAAELGHALLEVMAMPEGWRCVRATGGADANEQALKAVAAWAERHSRPRPYRIARFRRAYHGGTDAMLALSDVGPLGLPMPIAAADHPMLDIPTGARDAEALDRLAAQDPSLVGVMVEPVAGSGGVHAFPTPALRAIREICTRRGLALMFDEVITGCGRVGAMLHAHLADLLPDAVTLGKGLSAGAGAIGAVLLAPHLAEALRTREDTSSTFAWTPVACAAAMENLAIIEDERLHARAALVGPALRARVERALADAPGVRAVVRGVGMMIGIDLHPATPYRASADQRATGGEHDRVEQPSAALARRLLLRCAREGLWVGASWDWRTIVLLPPLTITDAECDEAAQRLGRAAVGLGVTAAEASSSRPR